MTAARCNGYDDQTHLRVWGSHVKNAEQYARSGTSNLKMATPAALCTQRMRKQLDRVCGLGTDAAGRDHGRDADQRKAGENAAELCQQLSDTDSDSRGESDSEPQESRFVLDNVNRLFFVW